MPRAAPIRLVGDIPARLFSERAHGSVTTLCWFEVKSRPQRRRGFRSSELAAESSSVSNRCANDGLTPRTFPARHPSVAFNRSRLLLERREQLGESAGSPNA